MFLIILGVLFVVFVVECLLLEVEHWGWATATLIATTLAAQFLHVADIFGFVTHHAVESLLYALGFLAVGVVWSFVKWFSFLIQFREKFREHRDEWYSAKGLAVGTELTAEQQKEFDDSFRYQSFNGNALNTKPKATKNKRRIVAWMAYWPFSMVGTIINDPVRRLFKFLFNTFKALYQNIADHVFRNEVGMKQ